jgi:hypothetical protein
MSVMATQLSAITMIGTTGQAYINGMRFLQNYYALPIAMVILSMTLVPFFHRANVFTAYQYLETRFDSKVRTFTALCSCSAELVVQRRDLGAAVGMSAFSASMSAACLLIGISRRSSRCSAASRLAYTDFKQMFAVVASSGAVAVLVTGLRISRCQRCAPGCGDRPADVRLRPTSPSTRWSERSLRCFRNILDDQSQVAPFLGEVGRRSPLIAVDGAFYKIRQKLVPSLAC